MGHYWSRKLMAITRTYYKDSICHILIYDTFISFYLIISKVFKKENMDIILSL